MATADFSRVSVASGTALQRNLEQLARHRNRRQMWLSLATSLTWALGVNTLGLLAHRFYLLDGRPWMLLVPPLLALLTGLYNGRRRRRDAFTTALEADRMLGWQDRLSSALAFTQPTIVRRVRPTELSIPAQGTLLQRLQVRTRHALQPQKVSETPSQSTPTELVPALVEDAATRSGTLDARQLYPLRFDTIWRRLALVTAMFLATCFMRDVPWLLSPAQKATASTLQEEGKKLEAVSKAIEKEQKEAEHAAEVKRLNKRMAELSREMQRGRMTRREALAAMGDLKKKLEQAEKSSAESAARSFEQVVKALRGAPMTTPEGRQFQQEIEKGDREAAAQQMEKLAERLEKGGMSKEEQKQASADLEQAANALRQAGGAQNEKKAQQMEQAAKALQQDAQSHPEGNGAQQQNPPGAAAGKALREMANELRQGGASGDDSQSLKEMLKKIEEAEAQTGTNSGGQSGQGESEGKGGQAGQGKSGQGENGQGAAQSKNVTPSNPDGKVGGGAGLGPRNNAEGNLGGGPSDQKSQRSGDERRWEDVWSDRLPATKKDVDRLTGKYGKEGESESLQTRSDARSGSVKTPYYEVYESYRKDAEEAIDKEAVPPGYKQPVKEYFESLKPEAR